MACITCTATVPGEPCFGCGRTNGEAVSWDVTLKTGTNTWSTITVEAADHVAAAKAAQRLLGNHPVTRIV